MKRTIRLLAVSMGLVLATSIGDAFAQADSGANTEKGQTQGHEQCRQHKHHHHHRHHRRHHGHRNHCCCNQKEQRNNCRQHDRFTELTGKLGLSDQQKAQMKEVVKKNRPQLKPIFTQLIDERRAMRTLIQSGSADEAAIRAEAAKVAGIEADLAVQRARMVKQLRANLTPEQIEKFKALQKERDARFDKFRKQMNERFEQSSPEK